MERAPATVLHHGVTQTGRQPQLSKARARQGSLGPCHMGDKHTSILLKPLLFWASSEIECLLTNPEGQTAKSAQTFPSVRQDAILVSCKKISVFANAGSALGSLHAGISTHSGGKGFGHPCCGRRNMLVLNFFSHIPVISRK